MDRYTKIRQLLDRINYVLAKTAPGYNGIMGGNSGLALYYFYLYKVLGEAALAERAGQVLDHIFETVNSDDPRLTGFSYAVGAAGFGYLMNHLVSEGFMDFDLNDNFENLDERLCALALEDAGAGRADFLHQSVGILHYLASKPNVAPFQSQMETIVDLLDQHAVRDTLGWRHVSTFGDRGGAHFDVCTAHGLSGTLMVLMEVYEKNIRTQKIEEILRQGIRFLTAFQRDPMPDENKRSAFPLSVEIEHVQPDYSNMLAWCYGDFGPTLAIARAGRLLGETAWTANAQELAGYLSKRLVIENNLVQDDSHFCHGASGVAQCFKSLYREFPTAELEAAYETWIDITMYLLDEDLEKGTFIGKEIGFLEGMTGVGLTLASALSEEDLRWDKALLL